MKTWKNYQINYGKYNKNITYSGYKENINKFSHSKRRPRITWLQKYKNSIIYSNIFRYKNINNNNNIFIIKRDQLWNYHCDDGPAIIGKNIKEWFYHGKRHHEGGPAIVHTIYHWLYGDINVHLEWYHEGNKLPCSTQEEYVRLIKLKVFW